MEMKFIHICIKTTEPTKRTFYYVEKLNGLNMVMKNYLLCFVGDFVLEKDDWSANAELKLLFVLLCATYSFITKKQKQPNSRTEAIPNELFIIPEARSSLNVEIISFILSKSIIPLHSI